MAGVREALRWRYYEPMPSLALSEPLPGQLLAPPVLSAPPPPAPPAPASIDYSEITRGLA